MISVSTSKSGSNWLDRLRSSRGFPTGEDPDLDRFLASSSSCSSGSITRSNSTHFPRRVNSLKNKDVAVSVVVENVSDVLCDLFNMGECSRNVSKKNGRKQANPRFFNSSNLEVKNNDLCSSDDLRRDKSDNALASSGDHSLNRGNCDVNNGNDNDNDNAKVRDGEAEEEEEEMIDMKEYTRSEVTVIDTSFEEWKSDKWVFRKKDVWKVRDKKRGKGSGKKRKVLVDENVELKKKDEEGCRIDVEMKKKEKVLHLNERQPQNDKARELLKEAAKFVGKVPQSRFPCPRPPEKLRIESTPVILFKSTPSSGNANGITRLGKSAKKGCPKKFKII
ncbi:uncharacterized protein LOC141618601 [Silene latifolia]|uniref:uncharacterized protein LOC141618601 n=1 Tax=Silene latifolia TaxID=37657 RepID=UPI003D77B18A